MDEIIVGIIVTIAVVFMINRIIRTYRGEKTCDSCSGCSCAKKESCESDFFKSSENEKSH